MSFPKVQVPWANFAYISGRRSWRRKSSIVGRAMDRPLWPFDSCSWGTHILHYVIARSKRRNIATCSLATADVDGLPAVSGQLGQGAASAERAREGSPNRRPHSRSLATTGCCAAGGRPDLDACQRVRHENLFLLHAEARSLPLRKWPPLLLRPCRQPKVCARTKARYTLHGCCCCYR